MRYYPIYILIKDLSFWISFFLIEKFSKYGDYSFRTEWWMTKEIIGASLYMSFGFIIINTAIFTLIYLLLKKSKIRFKSFLFGVVLHFFSLILIWNNIELTDRFVNFFLAGGISLMMSGYIYQKLNSDSGYGERMKNA